MSHSTVVLLAGIVLLAMGPRVVVPNDPPEPYFPTRIGTKWVYLTDDKKESVRVITAVEERDGSTAVTMESRVDEKKVHSEKVSVSARGICRLTDEADKCEWLLKTPAKPGEKWTYKLADGPITYEASYTVRPTESVEVPAGRFRCIRVDQEYATDHVAGSATVWYAPGVGEVKWSYKTKGDDAESVTVLKSFTPGKGQ